MFTSRGYQEIPDFDRPRPAGRTARVLLKRYEFAEFFQASQRPFRVGEGWGDGLCETADELVNPSPR